ncbi:condensin complex subunit SMC1 [Leucosporidium creatinivorum]|uniref:Structural maintenance of chromosomes protein n=1 Tax=Leucosporidium creatinivorum TaxID=106004 RepID=A0A1Y2G4U6_9BASI|nr:condensin complex subunit SMC1 [Leucosporidium creatinivorum]
MPIREIVLRNFKSYAGTQTIGPFHSFTAVIGPNGAGKSNLMDAISFVLGVRSSSLRSAALKDLIYRSGRTKKGKGKAADQDADEEEEESESEPDGEEVDGERSAWVMAVYIDSDEKEWRFQRSISTSGNSDYKLNGKVVTYKKYNEQLESFNILVKAKNFLVFQGDVEQVAAQSPKDLARLIDQISGSLDYKEEYDRCARELEKATEQSVTQHTRRKGVNGEIKQYKEMKKEAERWRALQEDKDAAIVHHLLFKLFHISQSIESNTTQIQEANERLVTIREENSAFEEDQKAARKEAQKAQKESGKKEKEVKKREKDLESARPELVAIDAKIAHAAKKLKSASANAESVERDLEAGEEKLDGLKKDLEGVEKAQKRSKDAAAKAAKAKGVDLTEGDLEEYYSLRNAAAVKALAEREGLSSTTRDLKTKRDALAVARDSLGVQTRKEEKLRGDETSLKERKAKVDEKIKDKQTELQRVNQAIADLQARKTQTAQTEAELNEKLLDTYNKLQQAGAERMESERDAKFRETLASLKKTFPGVKGRVIDLCKPTHQKYSLAVTTILGRNIDSVVVDNEKTAIDCIEYMRVQRAGQATFIPLETIQAKPANDKFRNFARGARLAIDVISFDNSVERAMQHACGDALVCDSMEVARHVCYEKGQQIKAVTLEGTVIHRSGLITGGNSTQSGGRHFEDREIEGLRRKETELRAKLGEIHKNKPRANAEEDLVSERTRLNSDLTVAKDDLSSTNARLKDIQSELKVVKKSIADLEGKIKTLEKEISTLEGQHAEYERAIAVEEDAIFKDFCKRIKVANIRVYEDTRMGDVQAEEENNLKFKTQIARLSNQITFHSDIVDGIRARLETLRATATSQQTALDNLEGEKQTKSEELETIEAEIEELREELAELQKVVDEKNEELEEVRRKGAKSARVLDKALKEIASCNDEIERLSSERFAVYRRCKLEEIDLPLLEGSLDKVPIDEALPPAAPMDVDGEEDETQQVLQVSDYGVKVDFEDLEEDEEEDGSSAMEETLLEAIAKLQAEIDKMSPNLKAIERLGDSEARFKEIDGEFDKARETAKAAKDAFTAVKKKRCDLFNKAYQHISDRIDEVYKDLTKGKAAPMGGVAYLSLEDSEEPYLHGIKYHAMPPMKRFRDMDQLSGGERTMASLSLLFAIHSYHPSPFFVLDEVDAALDNTNVARVARYVQNIASPDFQYVACPLGSLNLLPDWRFSSRALAGSSSSV